MKKINITTAVLLIYLLVMSVIGWPGNKPDIGWTQYCLVICLTSGVIFLLRFVQIKQFKSREKMKKEKKSGKN
jgi:Na+/melibiose symporter-like transporter